MRVISNIINSKLIMSEYCSKCSPFENDYDIDLAEIALKLDNERSVNIFCEGYCKIRAIYKDEKGNLYLAREVNGDINNVPLPYQKISL